MPEKKEEEKTAKNDKKHSSGTIVKPAQKKAEKHSGETEKRSEEKPAKPPSREAHLEKTVEKKALEKPKEKKAPEDMLSLIRKGDKIKEYIERKWQNYGVQYKKKHSIENDQTEKKTEKKGEESEDSRQETLEETEKKKAKPKESKKKKEEKKLSKLKPAEIEEIIVSLANAGHTASEIGLQLREHHGILKVKDSLKKTVSEVLKEHNLLGEIPEDLLSLIRKSVLIKKHLEKNKKDMSAKRGYQLTVSKIRRLAKYYADVGRLPPNWRYSEETAELLVK